MINLHPHKFLLWVQMLLIIPLYIYIYRENKLLRINESFKLHLSISYCLKIVLGNFWFSIYILYRYKMQLSINLMSLDYTKNIQTRGFGLLTKEFPLLLLMNEWLLNRLWLHWEQEKKYFLYKEKHCIPHSISRILFYIVWPTSNLSK